MNKKILLISTGPIWNVPPLFSVSTLLVRAGYDCELLGYRAQELPASETLASGVRVRRLELASRSIPFAPLRQPLALGEFLFRAWRHVRREKPDAVILFNDPLGLLLPLIGWVRTRIVWLLEYPEFERAAWPVACVNRMSAALWHRGTLVVAPTSHRLAIHCTHNPKIQGRPLAVVENAPIDAPLAVDGDSPRVRAAIEFIDRMHGEGRRVVVYSGGISLRHGIGPLLDAVAMSKSWALLLVGPYGDVEIASRLAAAADGARMLWVDAVPYAHLHGVLSRCDAGYAYYVKDTLNQRFCAPGKLYDYLMNGLPIITDVDSNLYATVKPAGAGVFFEAWTPAAIAACLNDAIWQDDATLRTAKEQARRLFESVLRLEHRIAPVLNHLGAAAR